MVITAEEMKGATKNRTEDDNIPQRHGFMDYGFSEYLNIKNTSI